VPRCGRFRARHPQLGNKAVVLFLSRIHPKKGLDLLIPAFAEGAAKDAMLVLAGPDADGYVAAMQDLVKQHGLTDRVIWTGMLRGRERIEALRDADLFVLPSYQENFGIAIIEALAAGSPVLISDRVNIWSEIKNARLGGVVPPEVDALTGEMQLWLNDRSRRAAAAERARSFVWENYDWRRIAERWARHYRNLLPAGDAVSSLADLQQRGN
jgi:glycosyltransferase involved in cell wall biosynthesis